jgi:hypothetical protein
MRDEYIKIDEKDWKAIRVEIWLSPVIIIAPLLFSSYLIYDWYTRGFLMGENYTYMGDLLLALIILLANLAFDIKFIRSLVEYNRIKLVSFKRQVKSR